MGSSSYNDNACKVDDITNNITSNTNQYVGLQGESLNSIMIFISVLAFIINVVFSISYLRKIFKVKKGVSSVEKTLCMVAVVESFISICWFINNTVIKNTEKLQNHCTSCKVVAQIEIFLYIFDWMILSGSLYQIRKIIFNPKQILDAGKTFFQGLYICLGVSLFSSIFSIVAKIGGVSPMLTCFINIQNIQEIYQHIFFWIFFLFPILCFSFGGLQVFYIMRSTQYKNDKELFNEYSYFIITYIFFSLMLIICYIVNYIKSKIIGGSVYNSYISVITILSCSSPLIVGLFRGYRTGFIKGLINKFKKNPPKTPETKLIDSEEENVEGGRMYNIEKKLLEKLILKYFIAVSYALGKSKYNENTEDVQETKNIQNEKEFDATEHDDYKITKSNILKDLDLSINEDIKVLEEPIIDIEVTEYNSSTFKKLRKLEGFDEDKIISMFQPKKGTNQLIKKIKETIYINSTNKLLMLKQIKKDTLLFYQRNILKDLYDYYVNHSNSIICRVFGLFKINIDHTDDVYMALMYNINESLENVDNILYPKNEVKQMKVKEEVLRRNIIIDSKRNQQNNPDRAPDRRKFTIDVGNTNFDGSIMVSNTSSSNSKSFKINLTDYDNEKLLNIINQDSQFLKSKNVFGFSFLVFERNIENKDRISIIKDEEDDKNENKGLLGPTSKLSAHIKKYVFNSSITNIIYSIGILDFKKQGSNN